MVKYMDDAKNIKEGNEFWVNNNCIKFNKIKESQLDLMHMIHKQIHDRENLYEYRKHNIEHGVAQNDSWKQWHRT
jgi:hypothetical protein